MEQSTRPQIIVLPFQAEGHIKPMLNLSKLLSHSGHKITFVNSHFNHSRLHQFTNIATFHSQFPEIQFTSITDGVPHPHQNNFFKLASPDSRSLVAAEFRELFLSLLENNSPRQPPPCIIADGLMSTVAIGVAQEFRVPLIIFRTFSATCTWVTIYICRLVEEGVLDLQDQEHMDKVLTSIPGLENFLRDQDLPTVFKFKHGNFALDFYIKETLTMTKASALILNTFDQLEAPIITNLATIFPKVYTIGPLHTLLNTQVTNKNPSSKNEGHHLRKEDRNCINWLDHQKPKSVLYVSFGTLVNLSREQILEFWYGLVNSLKPFLWVIRDDLIIGEGGLGHNGPVELELGTKERGLIVDWAPQEEVLAHQAVGGFLTHSGWNSTLESIAQGVPMLCWPLVADQTVNCRCASEQWKIGLDMNGPCDRLIVEKMVKDLMENWKDELTKSVNEIATKMRDSVSRENGSSYLNLKNLIKDISKITN